MGREPITQARVFGGELSAPNSPGIIGMKILEAKVYIPASIMLDRVEPNSPRRPGS